MSKLSRLLLALAAGSLFAALALPLWRVNLVAPQYPEGLGMEIHARTVRGATEHDLQSINSLNHYIGMKAIEPEAIPELRVIPWVIAALGVAALIAAALNRRRLVVAWLVSFAVAGAVGMWDFWKWEYAYGHDLDIEHAIIKVPGMTYQPPLIGSKQLLNFTATSWPSTGSYLIGAAFLLGVLSLSRRKTRVAALALVVGCASGMPDAIIFGSDVCFFCRMTISDRRFAASLVTTKGRTLKFDSIECLNDYLKTADRSTVASTWVTDYRSPGQMLDAKNVRYIDVGEGRTPMGRGLAAVAQ